MISIPYLFLCFIFSYVSACDRCLHHGKAAYFHTHPPLSTGACGYGSLALGFNKLRIGSGISSLYKDGSGCGACFQVRCKNESLCNRGGTKVVLFDQNKSNQTDFVLSGRAFTDMAAQGKAQNLLTLGAVDVEYRRIPCEYPKHNLSLSVEDWSNNRKNLRIKVLYQGGQTEIVGIDVARVNSSNWDYMKHDYGAVWYTDRAPKGALQFRFVVTLGYDGRYWWAKSVLPQNWKNGEIYDTGIQFTDIAQGRTMAYN